MRRRRRRRREGAPSSLQDSELVQRAGGFKPQSRDI
jgi:hypothetical protein